MIEGPGSLKRFRAQNRDATRWDVHNNEQINEANIIIVEVWKIFAVCFVCVHNGLAEIIIFSFFLIRNVHYFTLVLVYGS